MSINHISQSFRDAPRGAADGIGRRKFLHIAGAAIIMPFAVRAEQSEMRVIGFLVSTSRAPTRRLTEMVVEELRNGGFVEGQNLRMEYRFAEGRYDQLPRLAAELVDLKVDLIVATSPPAAHAAKAATSTIPIVFASSDAVREGLVTSLSRPEANLTGVSNFVGEVMAKRFALLSELLPQGKVIALLVNPGNPTTDAMVRYVEEAARAKGIQIPLLRAANESAFDTAFASLASLRANALIVAADPFFYTKRERLVAMAAQYAIPAIYEWRDFVAAGGLMSYGQSITAIFRQLGHYAVKILKGAKPRELPVLQPTSFELVINQKTATALDLAIPATLLAMANEIID